MLTTIQRGGAALYLDAKASWSTWNDRLMPTAPRAPVPALAPGAAVALYRDTYGNPYSGDPMYGSGDFYLHPERVMAALLDGPEALRRLFIDCDDVAGLYLAMVRQVPGYEARLVTLIDPSVRGNNSSHVICVYTGPDGKHGALDTNGHIPLPDLEELTLCAVWSALYDNRGYTYLGALATPYPF